MSVLDLVREDLRAFGGYSSARKEAAGGRILLNANESPWAAAGDSRGLNRYPDPQPPALLERLSELYAVPVDRLLVGRGSDEAIDLLTRALCRAGEHAVLISPPTFGMYQVCAAVQGAEVQRVPLRIEDDFALDIDAVLAALTPATRIVYVCSPNNPTGGAVPRAALERLVEALGGRALLVIDEAYAEFAESACGVALALAHQHVAVLRTLSKAYALAGARIGSLIADPALIRVLRAIMAPYPLPTPSVEAALQALAPNALTLARSRIGLVREERRRLAALLPTLPGVRRVLPSEANFLAVQFDDAQAVYRAALAAGIVLRVPSAGVGLDGWLRLSIGTPAENDALIALLRARKEAA
jgi:histidinol-phosphate aminotransferase